MKDLFIEDIPLAFELREECEKIKEDKLNTAEINTILNLCIHSLTYQIEEQNKKGYNWSSAKIPIDKSLLSIRNDIIKKLEKIFIEKGYRFNYKINYKYKNKREIPKEKYMRILKNSYENGEGYSTFKYGIEQYEEPYIVGADLDLTIYW